MKHYTGKLPGSFVEEKEYSVAFHFRKSDAAFSFLRIKELIDHLVNYTINMDVQLIRGNKVVEVRNAGIDKGVAALHWLSNLKQNSNFILSAGDDSTDEDLFRVMPQGAYSIHVGRKPSYALYNLNNSDEMIELLKGFSKIMK